jgi:hypothetical protein
LWVGIALASLAVLITAGLCVPVDAVFSLDTSATPKLRTRALWLFGLVSKEVGKRKAKPVEKRRKRKRPSIKTILEILRTEGLLSQFYRLLRRVLRRLRIRKLEVNLKVGLDDPADTGLLFALIGPASLLLNYPFPNQTKVEPSFDEAVLEGYLIGVIRVWPIQLAPPLLRFACSQPVLKVMKLMVWHKWIRKK